MDPRPKLLLSNDDGIDAPGLGALLAAAARFGDPVVVAPAGPQSGVSHTITWKGAVRLEERGERRFAIGGTPADCARLGLLKILPDANWVLSGVNDGGKVSYWLQPKSYARPEYEEAWDRLGNPDPSTEPQISN